MAVGGDLGAADYQSATRKCDIVMKGGITSGVVYPNAVCELAQTYRFQSVGGTSAGAIAAAATAAAEYGRKGGGFNRLEALPKWLQEGTNLRDLFQPQPKTRKLFAVLLAGIDRGPLAAARAAVGEQKAAASIGALLLALPALALGVVALVAATSSDSALLVVLAVLFLLAAAGLSALLGALLAVAGRLGWEANRNIADNRFGLCSGSATRDDGAEALTPWLTGLLNDLAGCSPLEPLTFGHLWAGPEGNREKPPEPGDRCLRLAMMTTNLVNRTAHQLPWEARDWFFRPAELRELFPPEVCDWIEARTPDKLPYEDTKGNRRSRIRLALAREEGLLALPDPADLPVVVAARMSLSFPVLLSAVPLWRYDMTRKENKRLGEWRKWAAEQPGFDPLSPRETWPSGEPEKKPEAECCWFSDGGISSNFPVHFFDRLVPRWPTFALNLRPFPFKQKRDPKDEKKNTWMVKKNEEGWKEWWYRLPARPASGRKDDRLLKFLLSIPQTMQSRTDEAQMRVPGYRDRVAHVNMDPQEGGMNLTMGKDTIESLGERGRVAAESLVEAYTRPESHEDAITWDNHRWVRLRSSLAVLEEMHERFIAGLDGETEGGERSYMELMDRDDAPPTSYGWSGPTEKAIAKSEIEAIRTATEKGGNEGTVTTKAPRPAPVGKIAPKE